MEKADGQSLDIFLFKIGNRRENVVWPHIDEYIAVLVQPLIDFPSQVSRDQGLRHFGVEVIEIVAKLPANFHYVPKSIGR